MEGLKHTNKGDIVHVRNVALDGNGWNGGMVIDGGGREVTAGVLEKTEGIKG